jgi:hypothetical protein
MKPERIEEKKQQYAGELALENTVLSDIFSDYVEITYRKALGVSFEPYNYSSTLSEMQNEMGIKGVGEHFSILIKHLTDFFIEGIEDNHMYLFQISEALFCLITNFVDRKEQIPYLLRVDDAYKKDTYSASWQEDLRRKGDYPAKFSREIKSVTYYFELASYNIDNICDRLTKGKPVENIAFLSKETDRFNASVQKFERLAIEKIGFTDFLYAEIQKQRELEKIVLPIEQPKEKTGLSSLTNNQIVLIFYYFFKFSKLEPRANTDISSIAKFVHLITGKNFTTIQNSDFYKRLMKAPNFKGDTELAKDLIIIRDLFEKVELKGIVQMIDNELVTTQNERKNK